VAEPSAGDLSLTRSLAQALALLDIRLLDHLIVAGPQVVSLAQRGLL
jgi:DNA repair protein RadC